MENETAKPTETGATGEPKGAPIVRKKTSTVAKLRKPAAVKPALKPAPVVAKGPAAVVPAKPNESNPPETKGALAEVLRIFWP